MESTSATRSNNWCRTRLGKRLRSGNFRSYRAYYEYVKNDSSGSELCTLIDAISTNTTHLFRERQHFDFLAEQLRNRTSDKSRCAVQNSVRIWSAGCSSGEEPYSIAMTVDEVLSSRPGWDWRILATDISTQVLDRARAGIYKAHRLGTVPQNLRRRCFVRRRGTSPAASRSTPTCAAGSRSHAST